jgi:hypothetical protein
MSTEVANAGNGLRIYEIAALDFPVCLRVSPSHPVLCRESASPWGRLFAPSISSHGISLLRDQESQRSSIVSLDLFAKLGITTA